MAEFYRFFNSTQDDPRQYQADDFSQFFKNFLGNGFFNGLQVSADNTMNTTLASGSAFIEGHEYTNTASITCPHEPADASLDRIDRVVLRLDRDIESRYIRAFVKRGEEAEVPEPPGLIRNDTIYELSLAQVYIEAGKSFIDDTQITDERGDNEVCGRVQVARQVGDQINTVDIKSVDAKPEEYSEGISQFYMSGDAQADIFSDWLNSIGISPSDFGVGLGSLRAYVHTIGNRTNTGVQTITIFRWDYQSGYEILAEYKRANNAISSDVDWGDWQQVSFVVESGENENGSYVRYSDGLQICWANIGTLDATNDTGALYQSAESTYWEYPKPFNGPGTVVVTGDMSAFNRWITTTGGTEGEGVYIRCMSTVYSESGYTARVQAIGRWR